MGHYTELYFLILPIPLITSSMCGMVLGIHYGFENLNKKGNNLEAFSGTVGLISIGMITGITYPITFPCLAANTLYKICMKKE